MPSLSHQHPTDESYQSHETDPNSNQNDSNHNQNDAAAINHQPSNSNVTFGQAEIFDLSSKNPFKNQSEYENSIVNVRKTQSAQSSHQSRLGGSGASGGAMKWLKQKFNRRFQNGSNSQKNILGDIDLAIYSNRENSLSLSTNAVLQQQQNNLNTIDIQNQMQQQQNSHDSKFKMQNGIQTEPKNNIKTNLSAQNSSDQNTNINLNAQQYEQIQQQSQSAPMQTFSRHSQARVSTASEDVHLFATRMSIHSLDDNDYEEVQDSDNIEQNLNLNQNQISQSDSMTNLNGGLNPSNSNSNLPNMNNSFQPVPDHYNIAQCGNHTASPPLSNTENNMNSISPLVNQQNLNQQNQNQQQQVHGVPQQVSFGVSFGKQDSITNFHSSQQQHSDSHGSSLQYPGQGNLNSSNNRISTRNSTNMISTSAPPTQQRKTLFQAVVDKIKFTTTTTTTTNTTQTSSSSSYGNNINNLNSNDNQRLSTVTVNNNNNNSRPSQSHMTSAAVDPGASSMGFCDHVPSVNSNQIQQDQNPSAGDAFFSDAHEIEALLRDTGSPSPKRNTTQQYNVVNGRESVGNTNQQLNLQNNQNQNYQMGGPTLLEYNQSSSEYSNVNDIMTVGNDISNLNKVQTGPNLQFGNLNTDYQQQQQYNQLQVNQVESQDDSNPAENIKIIGSKITGGVGGSSSANGGGTARKRRVVRLCRIDCASEVFNASFKIITETSVDYSEWRSRVEENPVFNPPQETNIVFQGTNPNTLNTRVTNLTTLAATGPTDQQIQQQSQTQTGSKNLNQQQVQQNQQGPVVISSSISNPASGPIPNSVSGGPLTPQVVLKPPPPPQQPPAPTQDAICPFIMPRFLHKNSIDLQIFSMDWYASIRQCSKCNGHCDKAGNCYNCATYYKEINRKQQIQSIRKSYKEQQRKTQYKIKEIQKSVDLPIDPRQTEMPTIPGQNFNDDENENGEEHDDVNNFNRLQTENNCNDIIDQNINVDSDDIDNNNNDNSSQFQWRPRPSGFQNPKSTLAYVHGENLLKMTKNISVDDGTELSETDNQALSNKDHDNDNQALNLKQNKNLNKNRFGTINVNDDIDNFQDNLQELASSLNGIEKNLSNLPYLTNQQLMVRSNTFYSFGNDYPRYHPNIMQPIATVTKNQLVTSCCRSDYDLRAFPFDSQVLQTVLYVIPEVSVRWKIDILVAKPHMSQSFEQNFKNSDWEVEKGSFSVLSDSPPAGQRVIISVKVRRIWKSYIWNIYLIFFLITTVGFSSFMWNQNWTPLVQRVPKNPSDSITISLLTLLTNISFKTYVSGVSPKLGYLTLLDVYILGCLTVSTVQVFLHAVFMMVEVSPGLSIQEEDGSESDYKDSVEPSRRWIREWFLWCLVLVWILFHISYYWYIRKGMIEDSWSPSSPVANSSNRDNGRASVVSTAQNSNSNIQKLNSNRGNNQFNSSYYDSTNRLNGTQQTVSSRYVTMILRFFNYCLCSPVYVIMWLFGCKWSNQFDDDNDLYEFGQDNMIDNSNNIGTANRGSFMNRGQSSVATIQSQNTVINRPSHVQNQMSSHYNDMNNSRSPKIASYYNIMKNGTMPNQNQQNLQSSSEDENNNNVYLNKKQNILASLSPKSATTTPTGAQTIGKINSSLNDGVEESMPMKLQHMPSSYTETIQVDTEGFYMESQSDNIIDMTMSNLPNLNQIVNSTTNQIVNSSTTQTETKIQRGGKLKRRTESMEDPTGGRDAKEEENEPLIRGGGGNSPRGNDIKNDNIDLSPTINTQDVDNTIMSPMLNYETINTVGNQNNNQQNFNQNLSVNTDYDQSTHGSFEPTYLGMDARGGMSNVDNSQGLGSSRRNMKSIVGRGFGES